jgi:hypothetical protein
MEKKSHGYSSAAKMLAFPLQQVKTSSPDHDLADLDKCHRNPVGGTEFSSYFEALERILSTA